MPRMTRNASVVRPPGVLARCVPRKDILFAFLCFAAEDAFVQALGALTLLWLVTFLGIYNGYGHGEVLGRSRRVVD